MKGGTSEENTGQAVVGLEVGGNRTEHVGCWGILVERSFGHWRLWEGGSVNDKVMWLRSRSSCKQQGVL
jgi:hypothetical protein